MQLPWLSCAVHVEQHNQTKIKIQMKLHIQTVKVRDLKVKRKSKVVKRVEDAGYVMEKVGREWHVWRKDDHSVTAIYDRLRDVPCFPPYV